jgi:hypothetical protein
MARVKGICYGNDAFPAPYDESNANSFQCTYGSDNAADYVARYMERTTKIQLSCGARTKGSQRHRRLVQRTLAACILWVSNSLDLMTGTLAIVINCP